MAALLYELLQKNHFSPHGCKKAVSRPNLQRQLVWLLRSQDFGGQFRVLVKDPGLRRLMGQVHVLGPHLPAV